MSCAESCNCEPQTGISKKSLAQSDSEIFNIIQAETNRQEYGLEMIPSENFVSEAVLEAMGSILTNKYAEGLPSKRYYGGCEVVDELENIANARAQKLFGMEASNIQPHSGAAANQAVYEALLERGDTVMGMRLDMGGHLTHGLPVNFSGKHYKIVAYGVSKDTHLIDYDELRKSALETKPKMIIAGASAYTRQIDFKKFREVADEVGAILLADVAHYAGLIAAGVYDSPAGYAHVVTTTTHKTLRGPRSGLIMSDSKYIAAINKTIFPGLQGGPHMHTIAAKAVAFKEASQPEFKTYAAQVIANARCLAKELQNNGFEIISGGTDSHMLLVDVRPYKLTGKAVQATLDEIGLTINKNTIPYDPETAFVTSGIRVGTPAITTRGMKEAEMKVIAGFIRDAVANRDDQAKLKSLRDDVKSLSSKFPLYRHRLV